MAYVAGNNKQKQAKKLLTVCTTKGMIHNAIKNMFKMFNAVDQAWIQKNV